MKDEIKKYIQKQPVPQQKILIQLRKIFLKTLPGCDETITWGVITFSNNKFYLAAIKDRIHIGFAITGLSQEEIGQFQGNGKTMRHIKITSLHDIDEKKIIKLIKLVNTKALCKPC